MKGEKNQLWAELREAQLETLNKVANTGMVVSLDCGEEEQLHSKNKQPVGEILKGFKVSADGKNFVTANASILQ